MTNQKIVQEVLNELEEEEIRRSWKSRFLRIVRKLKWWIEEQFTPYWVIRLD